MKLYITNTSRHSDKAVRWLATYAARYVRSEAVRCGWVERFDLHPIALRVTNTHHSFCGLNLGVSYAHAIRNFNRRAHGLDASTVVWDVLVRIGKPERFPTNSTYARYKDMPEASLNDWQEAVVALCAHEIAHIKYNYASGDRKGDEMAVEFISQDCVAQFRKERVLFDEFMASEASKEQERHQLQAARKSPEAVAARKLKDAEQKLVRWTRKQKLANTKVKFYTKARNQAVKRVQELNAKPGINNE